MKALIAISLLLLALCYSHDEQDIEDDLKDIMSEKLKDMLAVMYPDDHYTKFNPIRQQIVDEKQHIYITKFTVEVDNDALIIMMVKYNEATHEETLVGATKQSKD
jgi:hypothetical protein